MVADQNRSTPIRILCHGRPTLKIAVRHGWLPGARYTNLRDVRGFTTIGLIDIEWRHYDFRKHLEAVRTTRPLLTIARDVEDIGDLTEILDQAHELSLWCKHVVIVPKDRRFHKFLTHLVPSKFILGYSVPTRYGTTHVPIEAFGKRSVHLLGGRPDVQYALAQQLNVFSLDGNRFTLDASYGDYFNGHHFVRHPSGGYFRCIRASLEAINTLWQGRTCTTQ
jgi:hypothetical protein